MNLLLFLKAVSKFVTSWLSQERDSTLPIYFGYWDLS